MLDYESHNPPASHNPALRRVALATAVATFPLIFMGGVVTTKGAGMSVPDWPNSYGYNMFLFPPNQWVGGVLYEHAHRLMGTVVGFLSIVLALFAWGPAARRPARRRIAAGAVVSLVASVFLGLILLVIHGAKVPHVEHVARRASHVFVLFAAAALVLSVAWLARYREPRRHVRWLCLGVLAAVVFQGVLGGLRVVMVELNLAIVHACFAQAFFCLVAFTVLVTSRVWGRLTEEKTPGGDGGGVRLARLAVLCVALVYLQLVVGATMRHYDAGLAIPDLPLHYGKVVPPVDAASLAAANLLRANSGSPDLRPVTLAQVWLHAGHRIGAVLVTAALLTLVWKAVRRPDARVALRNPAMALLPLLIAQLTLGVLTVVLHKPADLASLHVAVGALLLLTTAVLAARGVRAYGVRPAGVVDGATPAAGRPSADRQNDPALPVLTH